ncbi:MAG: glucose/arabinose dehydrogenase [Glaciecola sp.]|jgi:glucose/arabinose dehydrogenase
MDIKKTLLLLVVLFCSNASFADEFYIKNGFIAELVTDNIENPTSMDMAQDGRIFVSEKGGNIKIIENGILLANNFLELDVDIYGERGLGGILLDKEFDKNGHVFVYYSVLGENHNRLSRYTAIGNSVIPESELVLLDFDQLSNTVHNSGAMRWALDTTLILTVGDGLKSTLVQKTDNFFGKILRINRDGSVPADNPFYETLIGDNRLIYALGFRNAFTMDIHPTTGQILANDVGDAKFEEVNEIKAGFNYGWPIVEGPIADETAPDNYQDPLSSYTHENNNCAIVGGAFYAPEQSRFPDDWMDQYFFSDYCSGNIHRMNPETGEVQDTLIKHGGNITSLFVSKDGYLYYSIFGYGPSQVWRVSFVGSGVPFITKQPVADIAVVGEDVTVNIEASGDATISYQWYFEGGKLNGETSSELKMTTVQLADSGKTLFCQVKNGIGEIYSDTIVLKVTQNQRPIITITSPLIASKYNSGDSLIFEGSATDPEDGALNNVALEWKIDFHHNVHSHPVLPSTSGISRGAIFLPRIGETSIDVWHRVQLTATDSKGLTRISYVDVHPNLGKLTVKTIPAGFPVGLDGNFIDTDYTDDLVIGSQRTLTAQELVNRNDSLFQFSKWSNNSEENIATVTIGALAEKTAIYTYLEKYVEGDGDGLTMNFYENLNFEAPATLTRIDPVIDYQLDYASFEWGLAQDSFTVAWTGQVLAPVSGNYTFSFDFDDRLIFVLDGDTIFERDYGGSAEAAVVSLVAGKKYNVVVYFTEVQWTTTMKLYWEHPYQEKQIIPQEFLYSKTPVSIAGVVVNSFEVFPNPADNTLNFTLTEAGFGTLVLFNAKGNVVKSNTFYSAGNSNVHSISLLGLVSGLYFYQIKVSAELYSGKIIKR